MKFFNNNNIQVRNLVYTQTTETHISALLLAQAELHALPRIHILLIARSAVMWVHFSNLSTDMLILTHRTTTRRNTTTLTKPRAIVAPKKMTLTRPRKHRHWRVWHLQPKMKTLHRSTRATSTSCTRRSVKPTVFMRKLAHPLLPLLFQDAITLQKSLADDSMSGSSMTP